MQKLTQCLHILTIVLAGLLALALSGCDESMTNQMDRVVTDTDPPTEQPVAPPVETPMVPSTQPEAPTPEPVAPPTEPVATTPEPLPPLPEGIVVFVEPMLRRHRLPPTTSTSPRHR